MHNPGPAVCAKRLRLGKLIRQSGALRESRAIDQGVVHPLGSNHVGEYALRSRVPRHQHGVLVALIGVVALEAVLCACAVAKEAVVGGDDRNLELISFRRPVAVITATPTDAIGAPIPVDLRAP